MAGTEKFDVTIYREGVSSPASAKIIKEVALGIFLNEQKIVTIACNGNHIEELAMGFLRSEGFIENLQDLERIEVPQGSQAVWVWTKSGTGTGRIQDTSGHIVTSSGAQAWNRRGDRIPAENLQNLRLFVSPVQVFRLMKDFIGASRLHAITGGTHSSALAHTEGVIAVREDIGRHNTIDMLGGYALLNGIECYDKIILRTGRVSSEIVNKIKILGIPVVISLSVPTSTAIRLSIEWGITMIGSVRDGRMTVYAHDWRVCM